MGLTFDATDPDGSPRKSVGMHRPPWPLVDPDGNPVVGYLMCSCGMVLQTIPQGQEHWQQGHFDRPLYEDGPAAGPAC